MTVSKRVLIALAPMAAVAAAIGIWAICRVVFSPAEIRVNYQRSPYYGIPDDKNEAVKQMYGGDLGLEIIASPDEVQAFRIGVPVQHRKHVYSKDFPLTAGPVRVAADQISALIAAFRSPDSYVWQYAKNCDPEYGVVLSFYRQADRVDVFLCFQCDQMMVVRNSVAVGGEDFDYMRPTLVRVVKSLFPSDSVIQGLTDNGCGLPLRADNQVDDDDLAN